MDSPLVLAVYPTNRKPSYLYKKPLKNSSFSSEKTYKSVVVITKKTFFKSIVFFLAKEVAISKTNRRVVTLRPGVTPGQSLSTMNPVNALLAGHLGSGLVRASTKYLNCNVPNVNG